MSDKLTTTVLEVLADFCFLFGDPADEGLALPDKLYRVDVEFSGNKNGRVTIICDPSLAEFIYQNLMDDESTEFGKEDAIREFGNVLTGNILARVYGEDKLFNLKPPLLSCQRLNDSSEAEEGFYRFVVDGVFLGVKLYENEDIAG